MKIEHIDVRFVNGHRKCYVTAGGIDYQWPFSDLVEFSDGLQDALMVADGLVAQNAVRPQDRRFMQLEGLRVSDAVEHNRNMLAAREVKERRLDGEKICGGAWYAEISMNGTDTDCSFTTLEEFFQIVQGIIKREMALHGQVLTAAETPVVLHAH